MALSLSISSKLIKGINNSLLRTEVATTIFDLETASGIELNVLTFFAINSKCFEALIPLSFGHDFFGLTRPTSSKPKHPKDRIDMPIFSDS